MNLDFLKNLEKGLKNSEEKSFIDKFITELTEFLKDKKEEKIDNKINNLREENCLYQVVDFGSDGVYLQNTNSNVIFEEVNIPDNIKNIISNDYILRYKDGTYIFEEKLTDEFFENMVDIQEYKNVQEKFIKESNILKNNPKTRYRIVSHKKDFAVLEYEKGTIKVPSVLLPYFINNNSILCFKNGKFHKVIPK